MLFQRYLRGILGVASDARLENDLPLGICIVKGQIMVTPGSAPGWTLDESLAGITEDILHTLKPISLFLTAAVGHRHVICRQKPS